MSFLSRIADVGRSFVSQAKAWSPPGTQDMPGEPDEITEWSAWAGRACLTDTPVWATRATSYGLTHVDLVLNDHSAWRGPRAFDTYDRDALVRAAHTFHEHGLVVNLMSWCMPHEEYLAGMANFLEWYVARAPPARLELDLEGPWTEAEGNVDYDLAATWVRHAVERVHELGVNGIGYADVAKLGPVLRLAAIGTVQAYPTLRNQGDVDNWPERFARRWAAKMPRESASRPRYAIGLPAYGQGLRSVSRVGRMLRSVRRVASEPWWSERVCFWTLMSLHREGTWRAVARERSQLRSRAA